MKAPVARHFKSPTAPVFHRFAPLVLATSCCAAGCAVVPEPTAWEAPTPRNDAPGPAADVRALAAALDSVLAADGAVLRTPYAVRPATAAAFCLGRAQPKFGGPPLAVMHDGLTRGRHGVDFLAGPGSGPIWTLALERPFPFMLATAAVTAGIGEAKDAALPAAWRALACLAPEGQASPPEAVFAGHEAALRRFAEEITPLPVALQPGIIAIARAWLRARDWAFAGFTTDELAFAAEYAAVIASDDPLPETMALAAHDIYARHPETLPALQAGAADVLAAVAKLKDGAAPFAATPEALGMGPMRVMTGLGEVAVTGAGGGVEELGRFITVDLGGSDVYLDGPPRLDAKPQLNVLVDLGGNDQYLSTRTASLAGALAGISVLADFGGDDQYRCDTACLGAAVFGAAALYDAAGSDRYAARTLSLGAALYGTGLLLDAAGHDEYLAGSYSQAFAGPQGAAMLADMSGHDTYVLGFREPDTARWPGATISFGQGAATGLRYTGFAERGGQKRLVVTAQVPGGVAVLADFAGNDRYIGDVFAQGAGYWLGMGMLLDFGGDDSYRGFWYAQGAAAHLGLGALIDLGGDDHRVAELTSMGAAHDRSAAFLADWRGRDTYLCGLTCLGSATYPGAVALLFERGGTDHYRVRGNSLGFALGERGAPDRARALFWDGGGADTFEGGPDTAAGGWAGGAFGAGFDRPGEAD